MTEPTDAELLEVIREAARGGAIRRDGSTSLRIARAVLAKWGTPAPTRAGEVVAWVDERAIGWLKNSRAHSATITTTLGKAKSYERPMPLHGAPQPAQAHAGAAPLTDEMASKAGRALSDLYATECGVDKEDNWKVYGSDFIATAKLVLEAVGIKGGQHGTE